jgi:arginyl-tRNA synthetase
MRKAFFSQSLTFFFFSVMIVLKSCAISVKRPSAFVCRVSSSWSAGGTSKSRTYCFSNARNLQRIPKSSSRFIHHGKPADTILYVSSSLSSSSPQHQQQNQHQLKGIQWLRDTVVEALNDSFDPSHVEKIGTKNANEKKKESDAPSPSAVDRENEQQQPRFTSRDTMVTFATKPEFGDYQCNAAMGLASKVGMKPRDCSNIIATKLSSLTQEVMEEPQIAGPGFINLKFKKEYLAQSILLMARDVNGRLAVPLTKKRQKVIVDYSSPNIAKEMHVGHLRSTIIGDTLANVLQFAGHDVKRLNHVGDWGTQFGMLVEHLKDNSEGDDEKQYSLGDLVEFYKAAKKRFDAEEDFKARAREGVVKLQAGDPEALDAWKSLCEASRVEYQKIYDLLRIQGLEERGESFYNPFLKDMVQELSEKGLAVDSEGARAIFLKGYTNRDGTPLPMIIRKSDGGYNYAATDLAAIRHRIQVEKADRILYVTDAGQAQHFEMVFKAAKLVGYVPSNVSLEHVPFGLVQGEDGKKFATRSGDTVKLKDLLEEAMRVAGEDVTSRWVMDHDNTMKQSNDVTQEIQNVIQAVGIGAVKYADLSLNRESNYKFSYTRMLSLNGNTAPYMMYAFARICGIIRKAMNSPQSDASADGLSTTTTTLVWPEAAERIILSHDAELQLARTLVRLPDILCEVESDLYTNRLCDYLFETSQKFNQVSEVCL